MLANKNNYVGCLSTVINVLEPLQNGNWHLLVWSILRLNEIYQGAELSPALVNMTVDLKFFPGVPVERDAINRVSSKLSWYTTYDILISVKETE